MQGDPLAPGSDAKARTPLDNPAITRRDFVGATLLGAGASPRDSVPVGQGPGKLDVQGRFLHERQLQRWQATATTGWRIKIK